MGPPVTNAAPGAYRPLGTPLLRTTTVLHKLNLNPLIALLHFLIWSLSFLSFNFIHQQCPKINPQLLKNLGLSY